MGGGSHGGDVDLAELLDVSEDVAELAAEALLLVGGQLDAGEVGDVVDVEMIGRHGGQVTEGGGRAPRAELFGLGLGTGRQSGLTPGVRIIGGMAGGRLLSAPKGMSVRPTPDRVRQAIFNSLGPAVEGAVVLDLFSGTGALGLEFLSRGAARVLSVELSSRHARYIRENAEALGLPAGRHELRVQDAFGALRQLAREGRRFDFLIADPPFGAKTAAGGRSESASQRLLDAPEAREVLGPGGRMVLGHARRDRVAVGEEWRELRVLEHGDSTFRMLTPGGPGASLENSGAQAL